MTRISLIKKTTVADKTMSFYFSKPKGYSYKPGQFAEITLINPQKHDEQGDVREFTLASAPSEDSLMITTRMRKSVFKQTLANLTHGSEVELSIPYGNFLLPEDQTSPVVMLSGGIGSTPFRSMIVQAHHDSSDRPFVFFSFQQTAGEAAFWSELTAISEQRPQFTFIPVVTKGDNDWEGEVGYLDKKLLHRYVTDVATPLFYLSGSSAFLAGVSQTLLSLGVAPEAIRVDEFAGY